MKIVAAMLLAFTISLPLIQGEVMNSEDATHGLIDVIAKVDKEKSAKTPEIKVPYDISVVENTQQSVDDGHSPWNLDPVFVAQVFASLQLSPEGIVGDYPIDYEDLKVIKQTNSDAIVKVNSDKSAIAKIYLKRLVRQDPTGIWTVVGYDLKK